jgi:tRNA threonylcarbamoyladenosine biosynthesis protein TsaB
MRILGIETSGTLGGFAVVDEDRLICELVSDVTGRHVEHSVEMIDDLLSRSSLLLDDLDGVAVSLGPGSFTGLRVGLATAKGICLGSGLPLVGVPTLDCIAEGSICWDGLVVPVRDARRGEVYFSIYESKGCSITRLAAHMALPPPQAAARVNELSDRRPVLLVGDAIVKYGDRIAGLLSSTVALAPSSAWNARPGTVAVIGRRKLTEGESADIGSIEPMYIRPSEAERMAAGHHIDGTARDTKNDGRRC